MADNGPTIADLGELELVDELLGILMRADDGVVVGPGDDAAVLGIAGNVVLTADSQHQGVHFQTDWLSAREIGNRAIAVNASDLGAMGATPRAFLAALALPSSTPIAFVRELAQGVRQGADRFDAPVVGGDVTSVPDRLSINITAVGERGDGNAGLRDSAAVGDLLFVTGHPGRAAAGRMLLASAEAAGAGDGGEEGCVAAFKDPAPPVAFGVAVAGEAVVGAMIDISDGLAMDLHRVCRASGVGAEFDAAPLAGDTVLAAAAARLGTDLVSLALGGGEDYQLLCSVAPGNVDRFRQLAVAANVQATAMGRVVDAAAGVTLVAEGRSEPLPADGWDPFTA